MHVVIGSLSGGSLERERRIRSSDRLRPIEASTAETARFTVKRRPSWETEQIHPTSVCRVGQEELRSQRLSRNQLRLTCPPKGCSKFLFESVRHDRVCSNAEREVSEGHQPPVTFDWPLSESAGCRWLARLDLLPFSCLQVAVPVALRVSSPVLPVPTAAHVCGELGSCPSGCVTAAQHPPDWPVCSRAADPAASAEEREPDVHLQWFWPASAAGPT